MNQKNSTPPRQKERTSHKRNGHLYSGLAIWTSSSKTSYEKSKPKKFPNILQTVWTKPMLHCKYLVWICLRAFLANNMFTILHFLFYQQTLWNLLLHTLLTQLLKHILRLFSLLIERLWIDNNVIQIYTTLRQIQVSYSSPSILEMLWHY